MRVHMVRVRHMCVGMGEAFMSVPVAVRACECGAVHVLVVMVPISFTLAMAVGVFVLQHIVRVRVSV